MLLDLIHADASLRIRLEQSKKQVLATAREPARRAPWQAHGMSSDVVVQLKDIAWRPNDRAPLAVPFSGLLFLCIACAQSLPTARLLGL